MTQSVKRFCRRLLRSLLAVALFAVLVFLLTALYVFAGFDGEGDLPADCGVVFGAAVHSVFDNDEEKYVNVAGPGISRRVLTAVQLYREKKLKRLIMSGGRGEGMRASEAEVMRDVAVAEGVDPKDITIETQSTSTEENLLLVRPLTGSCSSTVAISDRYHLARIGYIAGKQGWELSTFPAQRHADSLFEVYSVIREVGALFMFTLESLLT
ncbi:MAG: YdcF family protein [Candidatus Peribacteraceae bacterium]|jgi:vancomycin permeability regulator SanA